MKEPITTEYNTGNLSSQQTNYYDFTSKLYDNESPVKKPFSTTVDYTNNFDFTKKTDSPVKTAKYNVNLDDGMSSMDFLNSLKAMNVKPATTVEKEYDFTGKGNKYTSYGDNNFNVDSYAADYKVKGSEELLYSNRDSSPLMMANTQPAAYTVAYEEYSTVLPVTSTSGSNNDLIVVGSKIDLTPLRT